MDHEINGAEAVVSSFGDHLRMIARQSQKLSRLVSLSALHSMTDKENSTSTNGQDPARGRKVLDQIVSLESIVSDMEEKITAARCTVDEERLHLVETEEMLEDAVYLGKDIQKMLLNLPKHLPNDRITPDTAGAMDAAQVGPSGVPSIELVTVAEFDGVPKATRGRLNLEQVNSAIQEIQAVAERRHAFLSKQRSKLSDKMRVKQDALKAQAVEEHGGAPFITESELRACPMLKKMGKSTATALLSTLRSLKRLKSVQGHGTMTYVLQG
ncbi:unnamed protein product [Discosporangium mesarthrocarpum]